MTATALPADNSYAAFGPANSHRRLLRHPGRKRPAAFRAAFDTRTLFYDCFWHADGRRVILVGPPLRQTLALFTAEPGGMLLSARTYASLSTMIIELSGAAEFSTTVRARLGGEEFMLPIRPSSVSTLKDRKLLFSVNRDNDLAWIKEWATFHARVHGTDAVILFDNNSSRYTPDEVLATLSDIPELAFAAVPSWPYSFGPIDPAVRNNPYWARFLQIATMSVVLRRYGEAAYGLLDCDIDELAGTLSGTSIYDLARRSPGGLVAFSGRWIEATGSGARHRDFNERLADPRRAASRPRKWALDPSRSWVRKLSVHPYWHWIEGRPAFAKSMPRDALYWHFRGINTNWKAQRNVPPGTDATLVTDGVLAAAFSRLEA